MFPRSFYIEGTQVKVKRTAIPTGRLHSILALVNSARPWEDIITGSAGDSPAKKTLIFADHLFKNRSEDEKKEILEKIKEAKEAGFSVLILPPPEEPLELEWDIAINTNYSLSLQTYTHENIRKLALTELNLSANQIYILDYFGINELLDRPRNQILPFTYRTYPDNFYRLISTAQLDSYHLAFDSEDDVRQFSCLGEEKISDLVNKTKAVDLSHMNVEDFLHPILELFPELEEISFNRCINVTNFLQDIEPDELIKIKRIHLNEGITSTDLDTLFKAVPNLEELNLAVCSYIQGGFEKLKANQLKKLKIIQLEDTRISEADLAALLNAAPELESIILAECLDYTNVFENLKENQLKKLKDINLDYTSLSGNGLAALLKAAPGLEQLSLRHCAFIEGGFKNLKANQLKNLKKVDLANSAINSDVLAKLFNAAPNIEEIALNGIQFGNIFSDFKPNQFKKLKRINLAFNKSLESLDLLKLFNAAPELEEIDLSGCGDIMFCLKYLKPNQLKNLKKIDLSSTDIDDDGLVALLKAAPNLEEINLSDCKKFSFTANKLPLNQLKQLKILNLNNSTIGSKVITSLLEAAPNLKELNLANCKNAVDPLKKLLPDQLKKLKKIDLQKTIITTDVINGIFKAAPDLVYINFAQCAYLHSGNFKLNPLKKLKEIDLHDTRISYDILATILRAAPSLEKINLSENSGYENFIGEGKLQPGQLQNLKIIDISNILFGPPFYTLFHVAPNVEEINLSSSQNVSSLLINLVPNLLFQLKKINLENCDYTAEALATLFKAAPNLVEINNRPKLDFLKDLKISRARGGSASVKALSEAFELAPSAPSLAEPRGPVARNFFNTASGNPTLSYYPYFQNVHPSEYRLQILHPDLNTLQFHVPFLPNDFQRITLPTKNYVADEKFICQPGIKPTKTQDGTEIILPSLDMEEKVFNLKIVDERGVLVPTDQYHLEYSANTQFHRVVLKNPGNYSIHFQIAKPRTPREVNLPFDLQSIKDFYRSFPNEELSNPHLGEDLSTLSKAAKYIRENKKGRCELRALAAYEEHKERYRNNIRIQTNNVHAYIEMKHNDGHWYKLDLGGYNAKLNKAEMQKMDLPEEDKVDTKPTMTEQQLTDILDELKLAKAGTTEEKTVTTLETKTTPPSQKSPSADEIKSEPESETTQKNPILILGDSDLTFQHFYSQLCNHDSKLANDIFIAHRPEDISVNGLGLTPDGKVLKNHTPLNNWLKDRENGVIIVDMHEFAANEIAQLNDLLDRRIGDTDLPKDIRIILLDQPDHSYYGPDFLRRVPTKNTLPKPAEESLLAATPTETKDDTHEIDLFHSPFWQRALVGTWQLTKAKGDVDYSFQWQKGELLKLIEDEKNKKKQIIFKNPPLNDSSFTAFVAELQSLRRIPWADQVTSIADDMRFYQNNGYDWAGLANQASLSLLTNDIKPYVLSDNNLLAFIQEPRYDFSSDTNQLEVYSSYLKICKEAKTSIDIVCTPGLSEGALAEFLTAAKAQNVQVRFFSASTNLSSSSALQHLNLKITDEEKAIPKPSSIQWELHEDVNFAARKMLSEIPNASCFDMSYLEATELARFPQSIENIRGKFLSSGKFAMSASLSDILNKLLNDNPVETVVLTGKVPLALYAAITSLSLGTIEGKPIKGKLVILTPPEDANLATELTGEYLTPIYTTSADKIALLQKVLPREADQLVEILSPESQNKSFAELEREFLQTRLNLQHQSLNIQELKQHSDEEGADFIDARRLHDVQAALKLNPWVMIEGPTGIGKTEFLHNVFPAKESVFKLEDWLSKTAAKKTLIIDEASFLSQLGEEGENFLERFKGLKGNPPGFLWKGVFHELTPEHKVIFAFNPESYRAGRSTEGFLREEALSVKFNPLPDFYVRARIIKPVLKDIFGETYVPVDEIAKPIIWAYNWILRYKPDAALITPREIKAMVSIIAGQIKNKKHNIRDPKVIKDLATEVAYEIGKQAIAEHESLSQKFETLKPPRRVIDRSKVPEKYARYQRHAYSLIEAVLTARNEVLSPQNPDLGLGGIVLEGDSGIRKTDFILKIKEDYEKTGKKVYRISPSMSYREKEDKLREAFEEGALVVADEFNTSLWNHKLLNNFLMGKDEHGERAKQPGFFLLATQNPRSLEGRSEEDPAMRRRVIKLNLDWPVYKELRIDLEAKDFDKQFTLLCMQKYREICHYLAQHNPKNNYKDMLSILERFIHDASIPEAVVNLEKILPELSGHEDLNPQLKALNQLLANKEISLIAITELLDMTLQLFNNPSSKNKTEYLSLAGSLFPKLSQNNAAILGDVLNTTINNIQSRTDKKKVSEDSLIRRIGLYAPPTAKTSPTTTTAKSTIKPNKQ